ncbi:hypothetical protein O6H91_01G108700 [Diphasiastrum complanatum]|uniref:Uncharacterized protein n=1 Tax=Diphasiastrum complanatum TaxID=34168 RepID=A0ACC2EUR3_DIPCM|nr:hypothetical protein O6H91_01G108700 [Diphasiastrum complanatum]
MQRPVLAAANGCSSSSSFITNPRRIHDAAAAAVAKTAMNCQTHNHSSCTLNFVRGSSSSRQCEQRTADKVDMLSAIGALKCSNYCSLSYNSKQESSELHCTRRSFELKILLTYLAANEFMQPYAIALDRNANQSEIISNPTSESTVEPKAAETRKAVRKMVDTNEWFQFRGEGFSIRVPPGFEDILDPDESGGGYSLYGERAKPKTFAARFSSPDGLELVSVVICTASQLKLSFFEISDILELGSISEAAKMFIPAGARLAFAQEIRPTESNPSRLKCEQHKA